jgi:hypothetical protein
LERRKFLLSSAAVSGTLLLGGGIWLLQPITREELTIPYLLSKLRSIPPQDLQFSGHWNGFQTLSHLAQSVEFSMTGYPQHKSELFKSMIGKSAFKLFSQKGKMFHNLEEVIPGAAELTPQGATEQAMARLITALEKFSQFQLPLAPHFAYGELSHEDYALAHVMHVYDHFSERIS